MNPIYTEFFKAFALMLMQTQNMSLPESRAASTHFFTKDVVKEPIYNVLSKTIPGPDSNAIPIRIFTPSNQKNLPVLMFFHSGGWAFGSIEDADALCRQIANRGKCIVVAVDYRLSPENQFPKGLEDCYCATKWVYKNAKSFGGDSTRIAVGGESCGANLAATLTLMTRDKGEFTLKYQLLLYPVTTNALDESVYKTSRDQSFITFGVMGMFWNMYLKDPKDGENPYASPLKADNLNNLPPAYIVTAENDALHVEGEAYAERLREAHVHVKSKKYKGAIHSFLSLPIAELPEKTEALQDIQHALLDAWK